MSRIDRDRRVWLITGCSSGIGREIAKVALEAGARVAVSARDAKRVADLVDAFPDRALALALDVTRSEQVAEAVAATESAFGQLDVLVNNAGYGYLAAIEEGDEEEVRALFDTNFFGVIAMIKAVLPGMRARRSGLIVNVSSMTGLVSKPGVVYYSASKFALESLSEGLSKELAPFGIQVSVVKPGAFNTDYTGRSMKETTRPLADYKDTVGVRRQLVRDVHGKLPGDPRDVGEAVVRLSRLEKPPLHLLVGRDAYQACCEKVEGLKAPIFEWEKSNLLGNAGDPPA
jgi:NAD(P)-dependent dehydrogenase (short-subunit alcohol dehydrogenase family)